jgi:hypothetical protein
MQAELGVEGHSDVMLKKDFEIRNGMNGGHV